MFLRRWAVGMKVAVAATVVVPLLFTATNVEAEDAHALALADPQPSSEELEPGLEVYYTFGDVTDQNELANAQSLIDRVESPEKKTLENLAFEDGPKTLNSGVGQFVIAQINGFVRLAKGQHTWTFWSNDGMRAIVGGAEIYKDDDRHPCDNKLGPVTVEAPSDGWYEVNILYFNRKQSSCLFWDDEATEESLPPEVFAHRK